MHIYTISTQKYTKAQMFYTNTQNTKAGRTFRIVTERRTYVRQKLDYPLAKPVQKVDGVEQGW